MPNRVDRNIDIPNVTRMSVVGIVMRRRVRVALIVRMSATSSQIASARVATTRTSRYSTMRVIVIAVRMTLRYRVSIRRVIVIMSVLRVVRMRVPATIRSRIRRLRNICCPESQRDRIR